MNEIRPSMDFWIWLSILVVWLDGWDGLFFVWLDGYLSDEMKRDTSFSYFIGWMRMDRMMMSCGTHLSFI